MADAPIVKNHAAFIWSIADLLRGDYKQPEYQKVSLPLVVLRRFDFSKLLDDPANIATHLKEYIRDFSLGAREVLEKFDWPGATRSDGNGDQPRVRYEKGRWNGRSLREWMPVAVDDVVRAVDPVQVIVFGSVARGDEGPESDLDLVVMLDEAPSEHKRELMMSIQRAITAPVPVDVIVTDPEEYARRKDVNGSMLYWPSREGQVVYERPLS